MIKKIVLALRLMAERLKFLCVFRRECTEKVKF